MMRSIKLISASRKEAIEGYLFISLIWVSLLHFRILIASIFISPVNGIFSDPQFTFGNYNNSLIHSESL